MNATLVTVAATALAGAVLGFAAPSSAAPTNGDAQDTISRLEAQGNRVIVDRLSDTPLAQANIVGVQPGADIRGTVKDAGSDTTYQQVITGKVYYVTVR